MGTSTRGWGEDSDVFTAKSPGSESDSNFKLNVFTKGEKESDLEIHFLLKLHHARDEHLKLSDEPFCLEEFVYDHQ